MWFQLYEISTILCKHAVNVCLHCSKSWYYRRCILGQTAIPLVKIFNPLFVEAARGAEEPKLHSSKSKQPMSPGKSCLSRFALLISTYQKLQFSITVESISASRNESVPSSILDMGYKSRIVMAFNFLWSTKKQTDPSFLDANNIWEAQFVSAGSINLMFNNWSVSNFLNSRCLGQALLEAMFTGEIFPGSRSKRGFVTLIRPKCTLNMYSKSVIVSINQFWCMSTWRSFWALHFSLPPFARRLHFLP